MKKRALVFFPHNPWPPRTGAHKRCLEMLAGLKEVGCEVTLASSTYSTDNEWKPSSVHGMKTNGLARDVRVHEATATDYQYARLQRRLYSLNRRSRQALKRLFPRTVSELPPNAMSHSVPSMRRWFDEVLDEVDPDVVLMSYVYWDDLLDHNRLGSTLRMVDAIDLHTLNSQMWRALVKYLPSPLSVGEFDDRILEEDFFERLDLSAYPEEFDVYDKYDYAIAISQKEADTIERHTRRTKVRLLPMTQQPRYIPNRYSGPAIFPVGSNPFNSQGYLYFVKRVLPLVRNRVQSFTLQITGTFYDRGPEPEGGILVSGFLPDLAPVYELSRFMVCPVLGGTGQSVKIVEAMAHGLPAIALGATAEASPIRHGINGLVANSAPEFADHVVRLWNDEDLCRELGNAARKTIATEFANARLLEGLSSMIDS